jgi:hypothetical protein
MAEILGTAKVKVDLNKIYKLQADDDKFKSGGEYNIFVKGGEIKIYGSVAEPTTTADMEVEDEDVRGTQVIKTLREYVYFEQTIGSVSEIWLTGIKAVEV